MMTGGTPILGTLHIPVKIHITSGTLRDHLSMLQTVALPRARTPAWSARGARWPGHGPAGHGQPWG